MSRSVIQTQTLGAGLGAALSLKAGTRQLTVSIDGGSDALEAGVVELYDAAGTKFVIDLAALEQWSQPFPGGLSGWTLKAKADAGAPTLRVIES